MKALIILIICCFVLGCSTTTNSVKQKESVIVKLDTFNVVVPELNESFILTPIKNDSLLGIEWDSLLYFHKELKTFNSVNGTISTGFIKGRFNVKTKQLDVEVKQPEIPVIRSTTTTTNSYESEKVKEPGFFSRLYQYSLELSITAILVFVAYRTIKNRKR